MLKCTCNVQACTRFTWQQKSEWQTTHLDCSGLAMHKQYLHLQRIRDLRNQFHSVCSTESCRCGVRARVQVRQRNPEAMTRQELCCTLPAKALALQPAGTS